MLSHIVEWGAAVLAAGVVAGLVVLVAATAGAWWLYRLLRRRVVVLTSTVRRYALQTATVAVAARQGRLPPRVVHDLRRRINGPPEVW
jgi:hypothetical protein